MSLHSLVWVLGIWQSNDCPANRFWIILAYEPYGVTGVYPTFIPLKRVSSSKRSGTYRTSQIPASWRITWHTQKSLPISSLDWLVKIHQHNMCAVCPCNNGPNDPPTTPISNPHHRPFCGPYAPGRWELLVWQQLNPSAPGIERCSWKLRVRQFQGKDVCIQNKTNTRLPGKLEAKRPRCGGKNIFKSFVDSLWKLALSINMPLSWAPSCPSFTYYLSPLSDFQQVHNKPSWERRQHVYFI